MNASFLLQSPFRLEFRNLAAIESISLSDCFRDFLALGFGSSVLFDCSSTDAILNCE
jgi:hypothetical protein